MKIIKNYLYNVLYQVFTLIVPLITTPYITRVLGSEGVGINAFTNSVIQYFILAGSIGISLYGNRIIAYQRDSRSEMSQTFWSLTLMRILTITVAYVLFLFFLAFTKEFKIFYLIQSIQIIAAMVDISWLFMGLEDFKKTVLRNFLIKGISTIAIFTFVKTDQDIGAYIFIVAFSILIGNVSLWGYLKQVVDKPQLKQLKLKKHLRGSLTLFIPQVSMQIYLVLNKTMLGSITGVQSAGFFENTDKIVKMLLAIVTAIATVMMPRMANTFIHKDYKKLHNYLFQTIDFVSYVSVLMTAGLAGVAPTFSVWFMGEQFAITGKLIPILSLVCPLISWSTVLGSQYLVTTHQERKFTISVTAGAIFNFGTNLFLITKYGVIGAVWATVLSELLVTILDIIFVRDQVTVKELFSDKWKYIVAGLITFAVVRSLNNAQAGTFLNLILQALIGVVTYGIITILLKSSFIKLVNNMIHSRNTNR
ncbi:MAG: polysaccharide biosynthesis C-terminal domain-containing protein [Lactobacillaceae bacterium]|nr:polysaccharide biosynthesis C-terminal domain-containing protein [Lactobacillaceae bacterium]